MRFVEITESPIPSFATLRIWQAAHGGYTWAIVYEPGLTTWTDDQKKKWVGYTASYRRKDQRSSSKIIKIDGGPWNTFAKAEDACERTWRAIRNAA